MQFSTTITFDADDDAAALAEVQSWQLSPGATVHTLMGMLTVQGTPATVAASGELQLAEPPAE